MAQYNIICEVGSILCGCKRFFKINYCLKYKFKDGKKASVGCSVPPEFVTAVETLPPGHILWWPAWKSLNRLRTEVGHCRVNSEGSGASQTRCTRTASAGRFLSCPQCAAACITEDFFEASDSAVAVAEFWPDII